MKSVTKKFKHFKRSGAALIISMIFVVLFSTFALSLSSMCTTNVQLADNQRNANRARATAESGLEVVRLWINSVSVPGNVEDNQKFSAVANSLIGCTYQISDVDLEWIEGSQITVPAVNFGIDDKSFSAVITALPSVDNPETLEVVVTGNYGSITRQIKAEYIFGERASAIFDYGIGSRGPLSLSGNIELEGINVSVESNVYIESHNDILALSIIGNSKIAGDVQIVNPIADVYLQGGQASIGGETGQAAIDNHVTIGVPPTDFPIPNPSYFEQYVTNIIDSSTDTTADATYENVRIVAGTNPNFTGHTTLKGIVYIETPNVVTFAGNVDITGIIVGNGDYQDNSSTNQINITGSVVSYPVTDLPDEPNFADIKNEEGTFIIAPGFKTSFGGNFNTLNGTIASNGVEFFGNAGGTINGSLINYSDEEMTLSGNSDLYFNKSGIVEVPAGFYSEYILLYIPSSYIEGPFGEA